jgi:medium-chain acyl-[acyl-carrier-protein] hydrolase
VISVADFDRWFVRPMPGAARARIRLVVFPFAGGGPGAFSDWRNQLGPEIDFLVLQLPGRERRIAESPLTEISAAVAAIADAMGSAFDLPFAMFGHSMGAMLAFETIRHLRRHRRSMPAHLFVSGFRAPDLPDPRPRVARTDDATFIAELRRLGGTTQAVLYHRELMELLLPALRADFDMVESYRFAPDEPLPCPITAFVGSSDHEATPAVMAGWERQTDRRFVLHAISGSHFFVLDEPKTIISAVRTQLDALLRI